MGYGVHDADLPLEVFFLVALIFVVHGVHLQSWVLRSVFEFQEQYQLWRACKQKHLNNTPKKKRQLFAQQATRVRGIHHQEWEFPSTLTVHRISLSFQYGGLHDNLSVDVTDIALEGLLPCVKLANQRHAIDTTVEQVPASEMVSSI